MIQLTKKQDQNDLRDIVLTLTSKYKIDYLFLRENLLSRNKDGSHEIIILLSNKEARSIGEIDPQITVDLRKYENCHHVTFVSASVKEKLVQGNIFLFNACHPSKLIFKNPSCSFELYPQEFTAKKNTLELQRFFDRESFKIKEFKDGYDFYRKKENLPMAAFMLHQVFELRYRCMEILTLGKEKASHNIRSHHRYLGKTTSMLHTVFSETNDNDDRLLSLLNETYCAVRYEDEFEILEEDLNILESKMNSLVTITDKLFGDCLASFETEFVQTTEGDEVPTQQPGIELKEFPEYPYLKEIVTKILSFSDIKEIYLISVRKRQNMQEGMEGTVVNHSFIDYVLLLISETDIREEVSLLQNSLSGSLNDFVQLLGHSKLEVEIDLTKGKRFFLQVLKKATPIYVEDNWVKWSIDESQEGISNKKGLEKLWRNWAERMERADSFIGDADAIGAVDNNVSKALMYNLALEQIFLGLLEFFYDYQPQKLAFKNIFTIAAGIWEFPNEIFPNNTSEEKKRWKMLTGILQDMRLKPIIDIEWSELDLISDRCFSCKNVATKLVEEHYEKLKAKLLQNTIENAK